MVELYNFTKYKIPQYNKTPLEMIEVLDLNNRIRDFLASKGGLSPNTIKFYEITLRQFNTDNPDMPDLHNLSHWLYSKPWSTNTRAVRYTALKEFYKFCEKVYGDKNLMNLLERPKTEVKPIRSLTLEEVNQFLSLKMKSWHKAFIMLVLDTGLRIGEVMSLKWTNIDWEYSKIVTKGKTGTWVNPVSPEVMELLQQQPRTSDKVFPYSLHGIESMIRRRFDKLGINLPHKGPHMLRHTFARLSIKNGCPLPFVQQSLHHKKLDTTQRYIYLDENDLQNAHNKYSPLNLLRDNKSDNTE